MLEGVRRGERLRAEHGQRVARLRASLKSSAAPQQARPASQLLAAVEYERDTVRALLAVLRTLADAVVWRLLDYNRAALAVLGEGRAVRHLASGSGLADEIATVERMWEEGGTTAMLADLTTCIRHGDLLCIDAWQPRRWRVHECKAGRGGGHRRVRQRARLERLDALLNIGVRPAGDGEDEIVIIDCPVPLGAHHRELAELLDDARRDGYAAAWIEDRLLAEAVDQRDARAAARFDAAGANELAMARGDLAEVDAIRYSTDFRRIRDRRATFSTQAPLALLPYAAPMTADLCLGAMGLMMTLDCRALERRFAQRGIAARVAQGTEAGDRFLRCERDGHVVTVPAPAREQVLIEGLTLDFVVDVVAWLLDHGPDSANTRLSALRFDERAVWDVAP